MKKLFSVLFLCALLFEFNNCYSEKIKDELTQKFDSCELYIELYLKDSTLKALECSQLELEISRILDNKPMSIKAYYNLAQSFYFLNQSKIALEYLYKGLEICTEIKDEESTALLESCFGKVYLTLDKPKIALQYLESAHKYYELTNKLPSQIAVKGNMAVAYGMLSNYLKSKEILNKILDYFENKKDTINTLTTKINIAVMYEQSLQPQKALELLKELSNYPNIKKLGKIYNSGQLVKGESFYKTNNLDSAIYCLEGAWEYAKSHENYQLERKAASQLASIYIEKKDYKKAAYLYKRNAEIKDSILSIEGQKRLQELEVVYQLAKKEKAIENLQELAVLHNQKIWLMSIMIFLLLIIVVFIFYRARTKIALTLLKNKMLNQRLTHEKKELTNIALHYIETKKVISNIHSKLKGFNKIEDEKKMKKELLLLTKDLGYKESLISSNENIEAYIDNTYREFNFRLDSKYPNLSASEKRICSLVMLNFSSKEISEMLSLSYKSVNNVRSKLRKKLGIPDNQDMGNFFKKL